MVHYRGYKVKVLVGEEKYEIVADESLSLLQNLVKNGIPVDNLCGGIGVCGKCAVRVIEGSFSPPTEVEKRWMNILGPNMRLSCQVRGFIGCRG
jgi:ferredoxin